ncbi:ATPase, T2SS/T4P/T4SS family [Lachnobacterium bovis]|uniref:Pilus assembly protein CpaF n=1 Tax=Lachnobacterium bovis TaxID=140626 RepID=A0A1H9S0B4_9FIRM|nr:ATPase, T2SS/T4P/T4SS family [Lachnobacterium bovis]SER77773.1 pilus assembly protein CpaF [Lachnobacterium bovis]
MKFGQEYFGPLWRYIEDEKITDIDYNGSQVWLTDVYNRRFLADENYVSRYINSQFIEQFTQRIANAVSRQFNKANPELEAETPDLRVTIIHESVSRQGRTICIRKTPPIIRLNIKDILEKKYCTKEILSLLINCVDSKMNFLFAGEPGVGKTECLKFFSNFIPENERVITIEDTLELRYSKTNPQKDCVELKVDFNKFTYSDALKASLRLNPKWIMLSEARSKEVKYLLESWSTGVRGMTTLHTSDVRNIPDRILNMLENRVDADRLENDVYQALDVGILIRQKNIGDKIYRYIDQVCFFTRENGVNSIIMVVKNGELLFDFSKDQISKFFPRTIIQKLEKYNVNNPFSCKKI